MRVLAWPLNWSKACAGQILVKICKHRWVCLALAAGQGIHLAPPRAPARTKSHTLVSTLPVLPGRLVKKHIPVCWLQLVISL